MSHTPPRRLSPLADLAMTPTHEHPDTIAMRQLRHQTKNALQRLIAQISQTQLRATPEGESLAEELERRIRLSARVSDALFGLTTAPGPLEARLRSMADATVALFADLEQTVQVTVDVVGRCPDATAQTIVRVAHEMVGNAVKHGLAVRLVGRIRIGVRVNPRGGVMLTVIDDGWGPAAPNDGAGASIMRDLAQPHGGAMTLAREGAWTVARLRLPPGR